eukprot:3319012-Pyramimonas_sp.AAC.1
MANHELKQQAERAQAEAKELAVKVQSLEEDLEAVHTYTDDLEDQVKVVGGVPGAETELSSLRVQAEHAKVPIPSTLTLSIPSTLTLPTPCKGVSSVAHAQALASAAQAQAQAAAAGRALAEAQAERADAMHELETMR